MKRATVFSIVAVVAAISAISLPLLAGPFGGHQRGANPRDKMERHFKKMAAELKLTTEQQTKMTAARDAFKLAQIDLRADLAKQQLEIEQGMRPGSKASDDAMLSLFEKRASTQARLAMERYRLRSAMRSVLTPQQLEKMESMKSERGEKMGERMHKRMGMPKNELDADMNESEDDSSRPPRRPW